MLPRTATSCSTGDGDRGRTALDELGVIDIALPLIQMNEQREQGMLPVPAISVRRVSGGRAPGAASRTAGQLGDVLGECLPRQLDPLSPR